MDWSNLVADEADRKNGPRDSHLRVEVEIPQAA